MVRSKDKNTFLLNYLSFFFFFILNPFVPNPSTSSCPFEWHKGKGNKGLQSDRNSSSLSLLLPHAFPGSSRGSPRATAPVRKAGSCASFSPQLAVSSGNTHLLWHGVSHGPQRGYLLQQAVRKCLLHHGPFHGCRRISALVPAAPPSPSFFHLSACKAVAHTFYLTSYYSALFYPFFQCVFPGLPPAWLRGLAVLCGGVAGSGWFWCRATPASPR